MIDISSNDWPAVRISFVRKGTKADLRRTIKSAVRRAFLPGFCVEDRALQVLASQTSGSPGRGCLSDWDDWLYTPVMEIATALFANEAFYLAFSHRDVEAMERLWAKGSPVLCIHPGWPALTDRDAIIASWRSILQNPATGNATPHHTRAFLYGVLATVVCYEEIQGEVFVASNTFIYEDDEIRMVQHQASPCASPPPPKIRPAPVMQ